MALNLVELIKASGGAGTSGQSFRSNVTGAADTISMTSYQISGMSFSGSVPVDDNPGGYGNNILLTVTATFTRGANAYQIQRNTSAAWTFTVNEATASIALESITPAGSPNGATHALDLRIFGKKTASPTMSHSTASVDSGATAYTPWPVTFTALAGTLGGSGQTLLTFTKSYDPDTAAFNPALTGGASWQAYVDNRGLDMDVDFDYEWRSAASGGGSAISTARSFTLTGGAWAIYPTSASGLLEAESIDNTKIFLRWKVKTASGGNGTWIDYGTTISHQDPREPI